MNKPISRFSYGEFKHSMELKIQVASIICRFCKNFASGKTPCLGCEYFNENKTTLPECLGCKKPSEAHMCGDCNISDALADDIIKALEKDSEK